MRVPYLFGVLPVIALGDTLKRREFITLVGGAAAWPITVRAQQPAMPVVGYLSGAAPGASRHLIDAVKKGLGQVGYVEGRNITFDYRFAEDNYGRLPALAVELVNRRVAVIFASGIPAARAAKDATTTIPIVFGFGEDPVKEGIVPSPERSPRPRRTRDIAKMLCLAIGGIGAGEDRTPDILLAKAAPTCRLRNCDRAGLILSHWS
jgi:hypothetical protein